MDVLSYMTVLNSMLVDVNTRSLIERQMPQRPLSLLYPSVPLPSLERQPVVYTITNSNLTAGIGGKRRWR